MKNTTTISWNDYGEMYQDAINTFDVSFGSIMKMVSNDYNVSDVINVKDLIIITLETILYRFSYTEKIEKKSNNFVNKWDKKLSLNYL